MFQTKKQKQNQKALKKCNIQVHPNAGVKNTKTFVQHAILFVDFEQQTVKVKKINP